MTNEAEFCPFTVVVDSNESAPYTFLGLENSKQIPLIVKTTSKALWTVERRDIEIARVKGVRDPKIVRFTEKVGLADYCIDGHEFGIQIERKSISDLFSTLAGRRERFECEVKRLHEDCEIAYVVVEGDWPDILRYRESRLNPKSVTGTITAWEQRYPKVHWRLCPGRPAAELMTYRMLKRWWDDRHEDQLMTELLKKETK